MFGRKTAKQPSEPQVIVKVDTVIKLDTIMREKPVYRYSYIYDTIRTHFTTIEQDSVLVEVPMERRVYEEDSVYRAVLSGWHPQLDSLWIFHKEIEITKTVKIPPKKWGLGVTAGASVLATPSGQVHAGLGATVGVTYRF